GALYAIKKNGWTNIAVGDRAFYSGQYCYAVPQGNEALLAQFTEGLQILKGSGEYQRIYEKWLGVYEPVMTAQTVFKHVAFVAVPLLLIVLLALLWSWSLRRQVSARTRELRESLDRFQSVFEAANVGKSINLLTGEINPNKAFAEMLGYAPEELRGKTWQELTLPEDAPETQRCLSSLVDGRIDSARFEKRYVRKDGDIVWADVSVAMLRDSSNRPLHLITTSVDISERKRAEESLRHHEMLLHDMGRIAHIGGWEFDPDTGEGTWTDEVARIHDLNPADETSMEKGLGFYSDESRTMINRAVKEAIESGKPHDLELELISAKGVHKWVRTISSPIVEDGKVVHVRGSLQDITDRKRAESRIEHLNRVLLAIRDVTQLITHETDRDALLRRSCESLVSTRGYRSAWIFLCDAEGKLEVSAECGIGEQFGAVRKQLEQSEWPECYRRALEHPDGIATVYDLSANCKTCALANNYRDSVAMAGRLRHAGRDYGMLVVALPEVLADDKDEQSLFRELIGDIAYALHALETEQARFCNERTLQAIFQSANDGILVAEAESGRFILGNQAICRMLGYSEEETLRLSVADIHPAEALEPVRSLFDKQVRGEITLAENIPVKRKDGTVFPADVNSAVFELEGRRHLVGIFRDITERKRAEKALKEAYDIISRSSSVAFTWKNTEGWPVEFVSENVQRLLGYKVEEFIIGKVSYADCIHPQDLPRVREELAGMSAQEKLVEFVHEPYRVIVKDGSVKFVRGWTFIIRDKDGRLTHYKGIVEDITEKRSLEAQLAQAQKMEAVGRLAGGVAHDYNNMLSVIIGYSELAKDKVEAEDPLLQDLNQIHAAATRSRDITRQLLAFARKETIAPEVLDLNATVENMLMILRKLIGEDIDLAWHPGKVPGPVLMDPSQLDQILANLCVNARDAIADVGRITIETGKVTLDADYCSEHPGFIPGEFVLLLVSDNGCGMDRETVDHIFEPFFTTKGMGKGTGLGLSTVYGIVKQNNGFINVYSEPGRGTTFRIYLPSHSGNISVKRRSIDEQVVNGSGETLLVVEDEMAILRLAERILSRCNYKVLLAKSPSEALEIAQAHSEQISLLITDVVMPGMNGRELADQLKILCPGIRCIFMSGYTANVIAHRGVLDEGVQFIQKPFSTKGLAAKVREALET
ncbi:MAG: PAS domain S-box protein, partial [Chloroflexota bacterium]